MRNLIFRAVPNEDDRGDRERAYCLQEILSRNSQAAELAISRESNKLEMGCMENSPIVSTSNPKDWFLHLLKLFSFNGA